jgi:hypothetical protein
MSFSLIVLILQTIHFITYGHINVSDWRYEPILPEGGSGRTGGGGVTTVV